MHHNAFASKPSNLFPSLKHAMNVGLGGDDDVSAMTIHEAICNALLEYRMYIKVIRRVQKTTSQSPFIPLSASQHCKEIEAFNMVYLCPYLLLDRTLRVLLSDQNRDMHARDHASIPIIPEPPNESKKETPVKS